MRARGLACEETRAGEERLAALTDAALEEFVRVMTQHLLEGESSEGEAGSAAGCTYCPMPVIGAPTNGPLPGAAGPPTPGGTPLGAERPDGYGLLSPPFP